jgi:23S rRNA pseudouridine1911/1915/1917 synthase
MRVVPDPSKMNSSGMSPKQRRAAGFGGKSTAQLVRTALSFVDTLAFDGKLSVAQVRIETGRTHQIRVHLQDRTTPVYGDDVYGFGDWNKRLAKSHMIQRPLLHAFKLELNHPVTGKKMIFRAHMADDMIGVARGIWPAGDEERPDLFTPMNVEIEE